MLNLIKSIFISTFPVIALAIAAWSATQIAQTGFSWQYAGAFLASFPIVLFFALVFLNKRPRTSANLMPWTITIAIGMMLSIIGLTAKNGMGVSLAAGANSLWLMYVFWYSRFNDRATNSVLKVGQTLPDFSLEDAQAKQVSANGFKGNPSIYLFYRGNWCPLCMAQIKEIAAQYKELEKRGVNMVLISPQPHKYTASLARKFQVGFHFLVDKGNEVATKLNILGKNGLPFGFQVLGYDSDTVMPTIIITDKNGKILFADLTDNYRVRPEPSTFLAILDGKNAASTA